MKKKSYFRHVCSCFFSGCALFEDFRRMEKTAEQLAAERSSAFIGEDYKDAVKVYTDLKAWSWRSRLFYDFDLELYE